MTTQLQFLLRNPFSGALQSRSPISFVLAEACFALLALLTMFLAGPATRSRVVKTEAFFKKRRSEDKQEVERFKKSEVVKAGKLLPWDVKW